MEEFNRKEQEYFDLIEKMGKERGYGGDLLSLSHQAYSDYSNKLITAKAYDKIYAMIMENEKNN